MFSRFLPHTVTIGIPSYTKDKYGQDVVTYTKFDSIAFVISKRDKVFHKDIGVYELERVFALLPPDTEINKDYTVEYSGTTYIVESIELLRDIKGRTILKRATIRTKD